MNAVFALPKPDFDSQAHAFCDIHVGHDTQPFVVNLQTNVTTLELGARWFPVTVSDDYRGGAWVCSPCTAYGDYAIEELQRFAHPVLTWPVTAICQSLASWFRRSQLDRAVTVNNWLLSTNLYPSCARGEVRTIRDRCTSRWPTHSIWLRSVNARQNPDWLAQLVAEGFELIPSRQVYLVDSLSQVAQRPGDLKVDLQLLRKSTFVRVTASEFTAVDFVRAEHLYAQLYIDKYSPLNPQYSAAFLRVWHQHGLLQLEGLRDEAGVLQAVVGIFQIGATLTAPIVGYNTTLPRRLGLYRMLMACVSDSAIRCSGTINFSAGAAHFKRLRGATAEIEYSAVYCAHLPASRQRPIHMLRAATNRIGVPIMKRFQL